MILDDNPWPSPWLEEEEEMPTKLPEPRPESAANPDPWPEPWLDEEAPPPKRCRGRPPSGRGVKGVGQAPPAEANNQTSRARSAAGPLRRRRALDPWAEVDAAEAAAAASAAGAIASRSGGGVRRGTAAKAAAVELSFLPGSKEAAAASSSAAQAASRAGPPPAPSFFERYGANPETVQDRLLRGACRCSQLKAACHRNVNIKKLEATCKAFWGLAPGERAHLLRTLYEDAQEDRHCPSKATTAHCFDEACILCIPPPSLPPFACPSSSLQ
jgi:hypothetical protein